MRILVVAPYLASTYGGTSKVVHSLTEASGKCGLDIDVVTTNADNSGVLPLSTHYWHLRPHYRIQYFPTWHRSDLILSPALLQWLIRNIQTYDIIHTHTLFAPLITFTHNLCRFHKIPYIMTPHGMLDPWALAYKAWKKRLYYARFEKPSLDHASTIQVLTTAEEKQLHNLGIQQTTLIPNGIDPNDFTQPPNPEPLYQQYPHLRNKKLILFLGRIDPKKGLDLLAPAFARAHTAFPDTHLIIAGPDSINFTPTVQTYFANVNCLDAVTFTGMLTGPLKYAALIASSLYVCPSYSEGFSMSVLEGMASSLPCIITENCNFPEAHLANAAYVVPTNAQAIGDALLNRLHNPSEAEVVGQTARQFIFQNYTWKQSAKKLLAAYNQILRSQQLPNAPILGKVT